MKVLFGANIISEIIRVALENKLKTKLLSEIKLLIIIDPYDKGIIV